MIESQEIEKIKSNYFKYPQIKYLPHITPDLNVLTGQEKKHIDWELSRFESFSAKDLSELSHRDVPWISSEEGKTIEYESVFYRTKDTSVRNYDEKETAHL